MKRAFGIILGGIIVAVLVLPLQLSFEIRSFKGTLLLSRPVRPGELITLRYTHSVAKRPVDEIWEVSPERVLILRETLYDSFGAGLPTELGPGEQMELKENRLRIFNMDRRLPSVGLAVGRVAGHVLRFTDGEIRLADLSPPGSLIRLQVSRSPLWRALFRKSFSKVIAPVN